MNKSELRKAMHEKRNAIHKNINKFNMLCNSLQSHILNFPLFAQAETICTYAPTKSEMDTSLLSQNAWDSKKNVLFPLCSKTEKGIMHFYRCTSFADLESGAYGISEPKPSCPRMDETLLNSEKTVVLVPALSFSPQGYRLGYGQGFYDRFLAKIPKAVTIGITVSELISDAVPIEPWDRAVQYLATENGIYKT